MGSPRRTRAQQSRETLIEAHLPLVHAVARRYTGRGVELDDLIQVGSLGLVKASDRFDPGHGVAFAAFAAPTIEGEIRHHLRDRTSAVRLPRRVQRLAGDARRRQAELAVVLGRQPTTAELCDDLGADAAEIARALAAPGVAEALPLGDEPQGDAGTVEPSAHADDRMLVERHLRVLDDRQRQIVYLRFHGDLTERQIAAELQISQAHVSRLLAGALEKLRDAADAADPAHPATATPLPAHEPGPDDEASDDAAPAEPSPAAGEGPRHSGRFLVRMAPELHGALAAEAERRHVSLNRLVTDTLATTVPRPPDATGRGHAPAAGDPRPSAPARRRSLARTFRLVLAANVIVIAFAGALAVVLLVLALERGL